MRVGLTYDLRDHYLAAGYGVEETAEFDSIATIEGIEGALGHYGLSADRIGTVQQLAARLAAGERWDFRSEEHTSELQSLMRISYAVFCLKKKKERIK